MYRLSAVAVTQIGWPAHTRSGRLSDWGGDSHWPVRVLKIRRDRMRVLQT